MGHLHGGTSHLCDPVRNSGSIRNYINFVNIIRTTLMIECMHA